MKHMAKKKPQKPVEETPPVEATATPKKSYPSREKVKYVGIPAAMYDALEQYAAEHSTEIDNKSISWAARAAVHEFLKAKGYWPPPKKAPDAS